jgi:hypothetical protein
MPLPPHPALVEQRTRVSRDNTMQSVSKKVSLSGPTIHEVKAFKTLIVDAAKIPKLALSSSMVSPPDTARPAVRGPSTAVTTGTSSAASLTTTTDTIVLTVVGI